MQTQKGPRARTLGADLPPVDAGDQPLVSLIEQEIPVSVFLVNGVKLTGRVVWCSESLVVLRGDQDQMVVRANIATILPGSGVYFV